MARVDKQDLRELGVTGLRHSAGRVFEEWMRQLKGRKGQSVYAEMRDNDPVIGALLFAVDMLIRGVSWRVVPASEQPQSQEVADFVESCLHDMSTSWEATVSEILSFLPHGFSYHEIVYKRRIGASRDPRRRSKHDDGRIGWRKLPIRAQTTIERWDFADDGGVEAALQRDPNLGGPLLEIPIQRSLLFRTTHHKGNPEGRSMLRNAFRPWFFKKRIEEIEAIGVERDLAGYPLARVPGRIMSSGANSEDVAIYNAVKDMVRNIRRDEQEGAVFPSDRDPATGELLYDLVLLSTGGQRQIDTDKIVGRYDQRIAMTAMADFILLGHEKVGSFSLSSDKTALFAVALGAYLDEISSVVDRHAIPKLVGLNGFPLEESPTMAHSDLEDVDLDALGKYITALAGAGAPLFPDEELENTLRDKANLPPRPEGEGDDDLIAPVSTETETEEDEM